MQSIEAIILGLIQGLTEFIPVSSSGHLVIGQYFFDGSSEHLFLEWINIGTFLALLVYFRGRIFETTVDVVARKKYRFARNILVTALPAGVVGYFASDVISQAGFFGSIVTVIIALTVVGTVMVVLDRIPKASEVSHLEELTARRALMIGVAQVFALIPGVSRSGSTIIAGRLMGLGAAQAAEYSFLASIPIMAGVMIKLVLGSEERAYFFAHLEPLIVGNVIAFISGLLAIGFLLRYLSRHSLAVFGWYRIALATTIALVILVQ